MAENRKVSHVSKKRKEKGACRKLMKEKGKQWKTDSGKYIEGKEYERNKRNTRMQKSAIRRGLSCSNTIEI